MMVGRQYDRGEAPSTTMDLGVPFLESDKIQNSIQGRTEPFLLVVAGMTLLKSEEVFKGVFPLYLIKALIGSFSPSLQENNGKRGQPADRLVLEMQISY
jgi:hypothetical protein